MVKKTLHFGNPAYLSTKMEQLCVFLKDKEQKHQIPIEDIGIIILDHPQITITQSVIAKLLENNVALVTCNTTHHPTGLLLNLDGHTKQSKLFKSQINASEPLKKQLWQQTIKAKINNQAKVLAFLGANATTLKELSKTVKSGDATNNEAQAAQYYWKHYFKLMEVNNVTRERFGNAPNNFLNYGYAILRALVARNLVGSGLLPTLGIFHRNQYNAYCLADDIMEPYRPFVDVLIFNMVEEIGLTEELTTEIKRKLLVLPTLDVIINKSKSPLMVAVQRTTASLAKSFETKKTEMCYPLFDE